MALFDNLLHPADLAVFQAHFDAVRVLRRVREDFRHYAAGAFARGLVLLEHDVHRLSGVNVSPVFSAACHRRR